MKNFKTTLTGLILAVLNALQPIIDTGEIVLKRDWLRLLISVGIATLGYYTKDKDDTDRFAKN